MFDEPEVDSRSFSSKPLPAINSEFALCFSQLFSGDYVISHHAIKNGKLLNGKPIAPFAALSAVKNAADTMGNQSLEKGWVVPSVIYESDATLVWQRKASVKPEQIWFRSNSSSEPALSINAKYPALVFVLNKLNSNLQIFAKQSNALPTAETQLYHAPLCNINSRGFLCVGSAEMPKMSDPTSKIISMCEAVITDTLFTHPNNAKTFVSDGEVSMKAHIAIWKEIAQSGKPPSSKHMVKARLSLGQVIEALEKRK